MATRAGLFLRARRACVYVFVNARARAGNVARLTMAAAGSHCRPTVRGWLLANGSEARWRPRWSWRASVCGKATASSGGATRPAAA